MATSAAVKIEVRWRETGTEQWSDIASIAPTAQIVVEGLDRTKTYDFEWRGVSACGARSVWGSSSQGVPAQGSPTAISALTAASLADGVHLAWTVPATAPAGIEYIVERSPDGSTSWAQRARIRALSYTDPETSGTTYYYRVHGVNFADIAGPYSTVVSSAGVNVGAISATATAANTTANTANSLATQAPIINGGFDATPYGTGWTADAGWSFKSDGAGPGAGVGYAQFNATGINAAIYNNGRVGVVTGQTYKAQALVRAASANGTCYIRIRWLDATGAQIGYKNGSSITGNATGGVYAVDQAPAGAYYAATMIEVDSCTAGTYQVDNVVATLMPANVGEVPDGGGRYAVHQVDSNGLALIDFTQAGHVSKNLGNIADTATRFAAVHTPAQQAGIYAPGQNMVVNPSFALHYSGAGYPGWAISGLGWSNGSAGLYGPSYFPTFIENVCSTGTAYTSIITSDEMVVVETQVYSVQVAYALDRSYSAGDASADVQWYNSSHGLIGGSARLMTQSISTGGVIIVAKLENLTPPAGSAYARLRVFVEGVAETGGTVYFRASRVKMEMGAVCTPYQDDGTQLGNKATVPGTGVRAYADFTDNTSGGHVGKNVDNFADGTTYARIKGTELSSGVHKIGVAGSGYQFADLRNAPPILTAGAQTTWSGLTVSYSAAAGTPATATISVSAANLIGMKAAGAAVGYNASSKAVSGTGGTSVTYYLYYIDPTSAGGTQTLYASTVANDTRSQLGCVYIGTVTVAFPSSGTSSGGGAGGLCVCDAMWVCEGLTAGNACPGDVFDCLDLPTSGLRMFRRPLLAVERDTQPCVRIVTEQGAVLDCSTTTPFDVPDGRVVLAPDMRGELVITDRGTEAVVSVDPIGDQPVSHIHLGGCSYAAGADPAHRIYSHNLIYKP